MADKVRVHITVSGRVQRVFFRWNIQKKASRLGIEGWSRNLPDGKLEAVLEGERRKVESLVGWARKGPIGAKVDKLEEEWSDHTGEFNGFETRH